MHVLYWTALKQGGHDAKLLARVAGGGQDKGAAKEKSAAQEAA